MAPRKPDDEDFLVEKIVDKRVDANGRCSYLIKWKGYSTSENTWEPESHVANCRQMIDEFEKKRRTFVTPISRRSQRTKKRSKRQNSNNSSSLFTEDEDDIDIESIVQARRNPRTKYVEYEIQLKNSEKKLWMSSNQLIESHAFRLVEFLENNFLQ